MSGKTFLFRFAYQNGADSVANMVVETITGSCADSNGNRSLIVPSYDLELTDYLFGSCEQALPDGEDITDLEGTIIYGSNDDEPWIDGSTGSGSPPGERVEMLIDNDDQTKYLVRAIVSWVDIKTNRFSKLNGYTITSANDVPSRDPRDWKLAGYNAETKRWEILHEVSDNPVWESRFKRRVWTFDNESWHHLYRLSITGINGNTQNLMQMAELQLFGEVGEYTLLQNHPTTKMQLYPNPASEYLTIKLHSEDSDESAEISLFDMTGKQVWAKQLDAGAETSLNLNIAHFAPGLYIVRMLSGSDILMEKVLIE
jgi:hypothetical protein